MYRENIFSKWMVFGIIRGLVGMGSAEPINFERRALKPILTPNDAKSRQFLSSKKASYPSTEIHNRVLDHFVKIDGFCQLGMSLTYALTLWINFLIKGGHASFLLDCL